MSLNENDRRQNEIFYNNIMKMSDEQLLIAIKNAADYNPNFIEMAQKEIMIRGYAYCDADLKNINKLLIKHKTTDELVNIYTNPSDYQKEFEQLSAIELEKRYYDLSSLLEIKENKKKALMKGVQGSHIFLGYVLAVFGGIIGLFVALNYMNKKETLINGDKIFRYNESTRKDGRKMLIVWSVVNLFVIIMLLA